MTLTATSAAGWVLRSAVGLAAAVLIYLLGAGAIRKFQVAPEAEPDPDDLVSVDVRFRCVVCGAEVRMTAAQPGSEPEAPRHCREDMVPI